MSNRQAAWETIRAWPGPKLTVWGRRIHHGMFGCLLVVIGIVLALHDIHDRSDWFRGRWT